MWYGLSTQAMKDFGDKVANETRAIDNEEAIANHVMLAAIERARIKAITFNHRGTEMVPGFGAKRDYRRDF
jgi:hypothetical protein